MAHSEFVFAVTRFPALFAPLPKLAVGAAVGLAALSISTSAAHAACDPASPANTCRVTVDNVEYDVTTFTGSYDGDTSKFAQPPAPGVMPWWGNQSTATAFATAVGTNLGTPNFNGQEGPYFGYSYDPVGFFASPTVFLAGYFGGSIGTSPYNPAASVVWAKATLVSAPASVPGPLPLFGAAAAFGFSRKLRKRIQVARQPLA